MCVKLSLKNGVFQELQSYWKDVINAGTFTLSGFRKSTAESMAVKNQFFLRMGLARGLSNLLAFRKEQDIKNTLEDMAEIQAKL